MYAAWAEAGLFPVSKLLTLRKIDSDLEGHPTPRLNFVDVGTGSLGQGLGIAAGMAYCGKYYDKSGYRTYCIMGDGESAEGSVWEALAFASHYQLDNLCAIFDINRLGQSEPTSLQHKVDIYEARVRAFGFEAFVVDGHDVKALSDAFHKCTTVKGKPQAILAKTFKGKGESVISLVYCNFYSFTFRFGSGFVGIEDQENWHGKPLGQSSDSILKALESQVSPTVPKFQLNSIEDTVPQVDLRVHLSDPPQYTIGEKVRDSYLIIKAFPLHQRKCISCETPHLLIETCFLFRLQLGLFMEPLWSSWVKSILESLLWMVILKTAPSRRSTKNISLNGMWNVTLLSKIWLLSGLD